MHLYAQVNLNTFPILIIDINEGITQNRFSGYGLGWYLCALVNPWLDNYLWLTYYSRSRDSLFLLISHGEKACFLQKLILW